MTSSYFSLVSLYGYYLRRYFTSCGLSQQSIQIDSETTISFWAPKGDILSSKPSLVLLHGFGPSSIYQWSYQVKLLSAHHNLYVPDLIFFGGSTTKSSERSEVFQAVSMAKLLEKLGVKSYSVMGTSYGGFVAYNMAKMFPEKVEKVILASSAMNRRLKDHLEFLERAKADKVDDVMLPKNASQLRTLLGMVLFKPPPYVPDFLLNDFIRTLYSGNAEEKGLLLVGLTFGKDDQIHVSPLRQEVLVIWGEHDQIFPLPLAVELKEILGAEARLEVIKDASHAPHMEKPKKFNESVVNFLLGKDITSRCFSNGTCEGGWEKEKGGGNRPPLPLHPTPVKIFTGPFCIIFS